MTFGKTQKEEDPIGKGANDARAGIAGVSPRC